MCASTESFLHIRQTFIVGFAAFNVCAYVLGIGDRHLENFLVDLNDGGILGIDFGISFGAGLQLSVPELMPFRLTRQIEG
eukprot:CAMPEP_0115032952 /NCGR_PEP_ID=MMETSP0216-20121206/39522_1 /TAXON_ID=223996 /ORGANISM="Protocruzia adherens, Strain Boccale" /LENGTH=79 /DNA_ID=CAMNT_0002411065 /DNA_START=1 /DNA_END=236 /DNA_ORIENTATION=-